MTAHLIGRWEPNTPDWHAARAGRIGGSDMAAVIGISPWTTRDQLLADKATGEVSADSPAKARGRWLEPAVLAYMADRGLPGDPQMLGTWADDDDRRLVYNPDGVTAGGVLLEAKTSARQRSQSGEWGRGGSDQIPPHYLCQVSWGCELLGLDQWALAVLTPKATATSAPDGDIDVRTDFDFALYRGRHDPKFGAWLRRQAAGFLDQLDHLLTERTSA